jgi:uncharacterized membrane protein
MMQYRWCKWRSYSLAASLLLALLFAPLAAAEPARIALVITNQEYSLDALKLENTHRDGEIVKAALKQVGFRVWVERDTPNQAALERAIGEHIKRLAEAGSDAVGFLYYSGHGAADAPDGRNYLLPTGAQITHAAQLPLSALSVQQITRGLSSVGSRINFVVFDACRNVPLRRSDKSDFKGFAPFRQEPGLLIAYATEPGNVAVDSSLYARALANEIVRPGREAGSVFRAVSGRVYEATNQRQRPDIIDRRFDDFFFKAALPPSERQPVPQAPTGNPLAAGGYEDKSKRLIRTFTGHGEAVNSVAFSPDGRTLVSGGCEATDSGDLAIWCETGLVKLWDAETGSLVRTLQGHGSEVYSSAFSPNGQTVMSASGGWDGQESSIKLWDGGSGKLLRALTGHTESVTAAAFSADGRTIVSASSDKTLKLWDAATGAEIRTLKGHGDSVLVGTFYLPNAHPRDPA